MKLDVKNDWFDWLRLMSLLDGASYLILLGVAMPLKYLAGYWQAVRVVGAVHGFLFVGLCVLLLAALVRKRLVLKQSVIVFGCALIPIAPFLLDRSLAGWGRVTR